jgi:hypothetical protein
MSRLPRQEIEKLPYVVNYPTDNRAVFLKSFYDEDSGDWILFLEMERGKLGQIAGGEPIIGSYFSRVCEAPNRDFEFPLGTFITQHLSLRGLIGPLMSMEEDIHHFAAILEKYHLISMRPKEMREGAAFLITTELEYLITVIRSLYDLLQKIIKHSAKLVHSLDLPRRRLIADLPDSFARVTLSGSEIRSEQDLTDMYGLPQPLAAFYVAEAPTFKLLRDLRIAIEHHGESPRVFFDHDEGIAVLVDDKPWSEFPIWDDELLRPNRLGPIRAVFCHLISMAIEMTTRYGQTYASCIAVPLAIGPDIKLFLRNPFGHHLVNLYQMIEQPWERGN